MTGLGYEANQFDKKATNGCLQTITTWVLLIVSNLFNKRTISTVGESTFASMVGTGLDQLESEQGLQNKFTGTVGYLCNSASVNRKLEHGIPILKRIFGSKFTTVFTPQHGLFADVQDNMLESPHFHHDHFDVQVYSLYSETRVPKKEWLEGIDHLIIDLQDVGTRVYTYIYTLAMSMEACGKSDTRVTVLDRPNPIGGDQIEGNLLDPAFSSFVGMYSLPMRHGLTIGEFANLSQVHFGVTCELEVIGLKHWVRSMYYNETGLPWVLPSPNLPSLETAIVYPGMVLFEGTNLSEGRGTVRPFELFGHPDLEPFGLKNKLDRNLRNCGLGGFELRPLVFKPTFQKHQEKVCGGFQIHVTDRKTFRPWRTGVVLLRELKNEMGDSFQWLDPPYEYETDKMPIDILNGSDEIRKWMERYGSIDELIELEHSGLQDFAETRDPMVRYG